MYFQMIASSIKTSIKAACAAHLVLRAVWELNESQGESMLPTVGFAGDFVHINKIIYRRGRNCQVGDIVVALKPTDPHQYVQKRISGMPGDKILVDPTSDLHTYITVPRGHCWLTGDNLDSSVDSRSYGPVPLALIRGKVIAVQDGLLEGRFIQNNLEDAN